MVRPSRSFRLTRWGAGLLALLLAAAGNGSGWSLQAPESDPRPASWFCPMHADAIEPAAGVCGVCGMALVQGNPWDEREYRLELETTPTAPLAGQKTGLSFTVRDPDSGAVVEDFAVVHDKRYHLFVMSQDLEHFEHIHPVQQPDGRWTIAVRPTEPGFFRTYSDFLPVGGTPQVIARTFATRGFDGDLSSSLARLQPDLILERSVGGTTVRLELSPRRIVAGRTHRLSYHLEAGGEPVTDLQPYLAAWGHTLILSEDALEYIHAHPVEYLEPGAERPSGGPEITFDARFPRPGRYRIWTQFQRGGAVSTVFFTVEAFATAE